MIYALKYLKGDISSFETGCYDFEAVAEYKDRIEDFDTTRYQKEYKSADELDKDYTFLGKFIFAALRQKSMVTNRIFTSGNLIAGFSVDFKSKGLQGIKEFFKLVKAAESEARDD
jgi:hypothetical protein